MSGSYPYSQQKKDFLKAQFRYGVKLRDKLASGEITQEYYDRNVWLTTQSLDSPYAGWADEFANAMTHVDIQWLADQVGEDAKTLAVYVGQTAGAIAGGLIGGLASGVAGALGLGGWISIILLIAVAVWAFRSGPLSKWKV